MHKLEQKPLLTHERSDSSCSQVLGGVEEFRSSLGLKELRDPSGGGGGNSVDRGVKTS